MEQKIVNHSYRMSKDRKIDRLKINQSLNIIFLLSPSLSISLRSTMMTMILIWLTPISLLNRRNHKSQNISENLGASTSSGGRKNLSKLETTSLARTQLKKTPNAKRAEKEFWYSPSEVLERCKETPADERECLREKEREREEIRIKIVRMWRFA